MKYNKNNPLRVFEAFGGYGSQSLALDRLKHQYPQFGYKVVGYSDIEPNAIKAYMALHEGENITNFGDISKIDWTQVSDFDLFTFSFPCFVAGTLVLTEDGYKPIEEIQVGDMVLTKSNVMHKVLNTFDNGIHPTCIIKGFGFHEIHTTPNHKFWVRRKYFKGHFQKRTFTEPEFVEAKDLTKNHYLGFPVNNESVPFITEELDFWYMMGMYIGDGWATKRDNDIFIACNEKKLEKLCNALDKDKWKYTIIKERTCYKFRFSNKEIKQTILQHFGTGSCEKRIPFDVIRMPREQLQAFFNGYLDSDGCKPKCNYYQFSTVNANIAYATQQIVAKLYQRPMAVHKTKVTPTKEIEGRVVNQRPWYLLRVKLTTDKQDQAFYENGYIWYPFDNRIDAQDERVYNIEVEEDHSYIVHGAMVKNCQDISNAGVQRGFQEGSGTRSSLLWECKKAIAVKKPKYLLMENVKALVQKKFMPDYNKWLAILESYGYAHFWQVINSKHMGVPQNRERVFCVSILRTEDEPNPKYTFPAPFPLTTCLADVLEDDVDEKYFLRDEMLARFCEKSLENEPTNEDETDFEKWIVGA